jgi:hypothetical protein
MGKSLARRPQAQRYGLLLRSDGPTGPDLSSNPADWILSGGSTAPFEWVSITFPELENTHVVAMNVKRLQHDTIDPAVFRGRLDTWGDRVTAAGAAEWRTFMDPTKLADYLSAIR